MTEQAKEARREYLRAWRAKNKDKVRESQRRYWERRAQREEVKEEDGKETDDLPGRN